MKETPENRAKREQRMIRCYTMHGLSMNEVAKRFGVSPREVGDLLHRACPDQIRPVTTPRVSQWR